MPRPREFDEKVVVAAAKDAFWGRGYRRTAMSDLEEATGLGRSSLYLTFGTKRDLFAGALDTYVESFTDPLIGTMEGATAGIGEIVAFFSGVKSVLTRDLTKAARGCLMVNTIAELAGEDPAAASRGEAFRQQLGGAFTNALEGAAAAGEMGEARIPHRARMLVAATLGIWISARLDPSDAASLCDSISSEVESWRSSPDRLS